MCLLGHRQTLFEASFCKGKELGSHTQLMAARPSYPTSWGIASNQNFPEIGCVPLG